MCFLSVTHLRLIVNRSLHFSSFGLKFPPSASVTEQKLKLQPTATKRQRKVYVFNPFGLKSELLFDSSTESKCVGGVESNRKTQRTGPVKLQGLG